MQNQVSAKTNMSLWAIIYVYKILQINQKVLCHENGFEQLQAAT